MPGSAHLRDVVTPADPQGVVLVLHGGASRRRSMAVSPAQLSVLRMVPVAAAIARAGRGRLAVLRLLNSRRGWDTAHTPLADVEWALGEAAARFGPERPVSLVGHSLGGRAALLAAGQSQVRSVVALAPWVYADDLPADVHDTTVVVVHGSADRIASPERSEQVARRLARRTRVVYVCVERGTHAMLGRRAAFDGLAAQCVAWTLLGEVDGEIVARMAAGESWIEV